MKECLSRELIIFFFVNQPPPSTPPPPSRPRLIVVEGLTNADVVRGELVRGADDLTRVRLDHVLEDGRQSRGGALLILQPRDPTVV